MKIVACHTCKGEGEVPETYVARMEVGRVLRKVRLERDLSQREAAAWLGVTPQQLNNLEFGRWEFANQQQENDRLRESLAAYAHDAWSGWMQYLFSKSTRNDDGTMTIPAWAVERWTRQMTTAYTDLPEDEKKSDRAEADQMLAILKQVGA